MLISGAARRKRGTGQIKPGVKVMINAFQDVQKISQGNLNSAIRMWDEVGRNWQAIAMEMGAYSKRSFEDGAEAVQKLLGAKSLEQAFEIQSNYARRAYQHYLQELSTLGGMYTGLAKQAIKPFDEAVESSSRRQ